jgi:aldo/keto reductase family protein
MYLSSTGPLPTINAAGFAAAGCHGTGWHQQTLSDLIYAVEFVGADGQVHVFSEETTPNDMATVRVNLGTLGIITKVTLRVEPLYRLQDQGLVVPTENVMGPNPENTDAEIRPANLHKLVTENECPLVVANGQILVELPHFTDRGGKACRWQEKGQRSPQARGRLTRDWDYKSIRTETDEAYGRMFRNTTEGADKRVVDRVAKLAKARGMPRAQIALAWLLHKPVITAPIVGATKLEHLDDALGSLEVKLSAEDIAALEEPYAPHAVAGFT